MVRNVDTSALFRRQTSHEPNLMLMTQQWRTLREILGGGGGEIFNMYAFGVGLRYANLSNIVLGISSSLFDILLCPPLFQNTNSSFENTNSSFENTNSSFENTNSSFQTDLSCLFELICIRFGT